VDKYIYDETKGYLIGLPARDISADEWKTYPDELTKPALKMGMYKLQKKEVKDER
jgi:hypothetical protein